MKRFSAALGAVLFASLLVVVAPTAASAGCDYSDASENNGWGWDAATRSSCSPLPAPAPQQPSASGQTPPPTDGCDYSAASQNGGWGWNPTTRSSCPPNQTEAGAGTLVQPRLIRAVRHQTAVALDWEADSADSFVVLRNGTKIAETLGSAFTDTGLVANATYKYTVFARRGATVAPSGGRPLPVLPPSWPTVELTPGTNGDVAGASTTPSQEIQASLQAIEDGIIGWVTGIINPGPSVPGTRNTPPIIAQLLAVILGANPVATQEAEATGVINGFLAASGSTMRMPNPASRPGSTPSVQYGLASGARNEIKDDIDGFVDDHGRYPDQVETLAIVRAVMNEYVRRGMNVSGTSYDPGSPESIAEEYLGPDQDGTLGEFGGTDSEENAAADAAAQDAADTYAGGDRGGEFGTSTNETHGGSDGDNATDSSNSESSGGSSNNNGGNNNGGDDSGADSSGGQSTGEQAAETYSGGDSAGEFG